jgi:hypothetical protein
MRRREFFYTLALPYAFNISLSGQTKEHRLPRKDCFFGLHFDLHPGPTDTVLGRDVTDEMVERLLQRVKPDYVQYDCKGGPGYLGYPSHVGTPAPGIVKDSLEIWRRVTARHGVSLFIHFAGLYDTLAIEQHPDWAEVRSDGTFDPDRVSTFSPYVDERMIPLLKEAAEKYDLDGAWVDAECSEVHPDYSPAALRAFRAATGMEKVPQGPNNAGWREFLEFNRQQFREHVRSFAEALHKFRPGFQICSNWLYTTFMPERPEIPVDFVSGDYPGNAGLRLDARYLSSGTLPWDLMAWGFKGQSNNQKPAVQVEQEAAVILAQGGGFEVYYQPTRAGKIDSRIIGVMAEVAEFCRTRQRLTHKSESIPQIGLLFSKNSLYSTATRRLFGGWGTAANPVQGFLDALVENHYSVDIIPDWKLEEAAGRYPVIVVPEWPDIGLQAKLVLTRYVEAGGNLLIAGKENAALFLNELGVRLVGTASEADVSVAGDKLFGNASGAWQEVDPAGSTQMIETRYPTFDTSRDGKCAATLSRFGKGQIACIYGPMGSAFLAHHGAANREFIRRVVERIFSPKVRLEGPPTVEVALRNKGGKLLVHLINCTAMQTASEYEVVDFIPTVGPLGLSVELPSKPQHVTLEPEGRVLTGQWSNGVWSATLDQLHIHSIIAFEQT